MPTFSRTISVHVQELGSACFFWVLMERTEGALMFTDLDVAQWPEGTWEAALDAGVVELKRVVTQGANEPCDGIEDEDADPVG